MKKKALVVIDVQKAFENEKIFGKVSNPRVSMNIASTIEKFRVKGDLIIYIQHRNMGVDSQFNPVNKGFQFQDIINPLETEPIVIKDVNSAFIGTDLEEILELNKIEKLYICGLKTPHCVSTTTRMAGNLGYNTHLIEECTASFPLVDKNNELISESDIQRISIATLNDEFAKIVKSSDL